MATNDLIGTKDAADILGVSTRTVKRLAASGDLPHAAKLPGPLGAYLFQRSVVELVNRNRSKKAS